MLSKDITSSLLRSRQSSLDLGAFPFFSVGWSQKPRSSGVSDTKLHAYFHTLRSHGHRLMQAQSRTGVARALLLKGNGCSHKL